MAVTFDLVVKKCTAFSVGISAFYFICEPNILFPGRTLYSFIAVLLFAVCFFIFTVNWCLSVSCAGIGNLFAAFLLPTLIYYFRLGVTGAAMSTVISQYVIFDSFLICTLLFWLYLVTEQYQIFVFRYTVTFLMIWFLNKKAVLLPPKMGSLQFGGYIKSGKFCHSSWQTLPMKFSHIALQYHLGHDSCT